MAAHLLKNLKVASWWFIGAIRDMAIWSRIEKS